VCSSLFKSGNRSAAEVVAEALQNSPERPIKMKRGGVSEVIPYSAEKALALMLDGRLTKRSYKKIRTEAIARRAPLYPSYEAVLKAKKACYPEGITITDRGTDMASTIKYLLLHTQF